MTDSSLPINAPPPERVAHAALRGGVAAMAMTGMRVLTTELGLVEEPPPQAIFRQKARGLLRLVPRKRRRAAIELAHWGYGAGGGAAFGALPTAVRRQAWAGPVYGLAVWAGFEIGLAPLLGLEQAGQKRPAERAALALDHLLYGLILAELRSRPRD
ncbi:MAG: hypothetical protein QM729_09335 [Solirubrobacterales bacterium]